MRFGHFDDEAREYVITTPQTPYPWINYLGSEQLLLPALAPGGWLQLLPGSASSPADPLPLQQRPQ